MNAEFDSTYTQYQSQRSALRRWVRQAYLRRAASFVDGPTLDFGCGVGELLRILPHGSSGLEYNRSTVDYCRERVLPVEHYDGFADGWQLSALPADRYFKSMVISHVLEHLREPMDVLHRLGSASLRHGVERILVIVPGKAGFRIDPTHLTFVDLAMLVESSPLDAAGFRCARAEYYPGDLRMIGDVFPYHELQVLFTRNSAGGAPA